jgi:hypothetical protein
MSAAEPPRAAVHSSHSGRRSVARLRGAGGQAAIPPFAGGRQPMLGHAAFPTSAIRPLQFDVATCRGFHDPGPRPSGAGGAAFIRARRAEAIDPGLPRQTMALGRPAIERIFRAPSIGDLTARRPDRHRVHRVGDLAPGSGVRNQGESDECPEDFRCSRPRFFQFSRGLEPGTCKSCLAFNVTGARAEERAVWRGEAGVPRGTTSIDSSRACRQAPMIALRMRSRSWAEP